MQVLARFAVRRRWLVLAAWVIAIIALQALATGVGGSSYKNDFKLPHTETNTVSNLLKDAGLASQNGTSGTVVIHALSGTVADKAAVLQPAFQQLCTANLGIDNILSPYGKIACTPAKSGSSGGAAATALGPVSTDKTIGLTTITWTEANPEPKKITDTYDKLKTLSNSGLQLEFTGNGFQALGFQSKGIPPEAFGFIAALIILLLVFRTFGATVLPLISAIAALGSGLALISLLTHVMSVADFASQLATLMVLGVGIDYALFIVTRHRRNLLRGLSVDDSIVVAINTSGRAVLFAGITVCIALLGLCSLNVSFLYGVSVGTALSVALTMLASLTLLPAMLRFLGLRVLPRSQRKEVAAGDFHPEEAHGFWSNWSKMIEKRKIVVGATAIVILAVLAIPFFSMRLGNSDQGTDPSNTTTRKGYDLIAQGFGQGFNSALELVVSGPTATQAAYLSTVTTKLKTVTDVTPSSVQAIPIGSDIALISFKSQTSPQDAKTTSLVKNLRSNVLPPLISGTGNHIYVYGATAIFVDFAKVLASKMPLFFTAVIGLSFLLLMMAFRSLVVPLTAAAMNLLAAGAAFGVVVAIFQWGWGSDALGIGGSGPIEPFIPVMFFAILFGLSMDYQVFLVSRMHEEWIHTRNNERAVRIGQAETGGIITAAAIIMIAVFGGFILGDQRIIKLLGIGLASAVFLDAFIIRTLLVPALMHIFGDANWWYPKWLEKITPSFSIEPGDDDESAEYGGGGAEPDEEFAKV